jgi:hypothetical protein
VKSKGAHLFANFSGKIRAELLDEAGKVIGTSESVSGDSTKQRIHLPGLAGSTGKPVRFRFHLTEASLYSFWVTTDPRGTSGGYLGAGGPGYEGVQDLPQSSP